MSSLPLTALRPLTFPSHRWSALVCLRTGRVLALVPASTLADAAVSAQMPAAAPAMDMPRATNAFLDTFGLSAHSNVRSLHSRRHSAHNLNQF
jgi:hypothetical protein